MDIGSLFQQAKKMQEEMDRIKEDISKKRADGESGGGLIKATVTGAGKLISLKISKEAVETGDIEMLEDLIVAAVNKAIQEAGRLAEDEMSKMKSMIPNIPGLNLPF